MCLSLSLFLLSLLSSLSPKRRKKTQEINHGSYLFSFAEEGGTMSFLAKVITRDLKVRTHFQPSTKDADKRKSFHAVTCSTVKFLKRELRREEEGGGGGGAGGERKMKSCSISTEQTQSHASFDALFSTRLRNSPPGPVTTNTAWEQSTGPCHHQHGLGTVHRALSPPTRLGNSPPGPVTTG